MRPTVSVASMNASGGSRQRADHRRQAWVKSLYHVDIDDARLFSLVLDASRFTPERLVATLLAASGIQAALVST